MAIAPIMLRTELKNADTVSHRERGADGLVVDGAAAVPALTAAPHVPTDPDGRTVDVLAS